MKNPIELQILRQTKQTKNKIIKHYQCIVVLIKCLFLSSNTSFISPQSILFNFSVAAVQEIVSREPTKLDEIMKEVLKNHKQEIHYSCSQCAFTMANKKHYVMHMLTTHTTFNEETRLMHFCHLCNYQTIYKHQMKRHIENSHIKKEKLHCPFCSFSSYYTINLKKHIMIHEDLQNMTCSHPQCDFKTSYKFSLQRHEIKIHGNQCSICQYKNKNRTAIQRHLRVVHGVYEVHHCNKCSFKTFYLMSLKRHNAKQHKGVMPKYNFTSVKKTKDELTAEEEEEINNLFKNSN